MLTNVLPGLRELRAPLAAGYLWLLFAWLVWGDELLKSRRAEAADRGRTPLDRLFELEPFISSIGLAVVASVAAYVLGSIVIDVQTAIGRGFAELNVVGRLVVAAVFVMGASALQAVRSDGATWAVVVTAVTTAVIAVALIGSILVTGGSDWWLTVSTALTARARPTGGRLALTAAGSSTLGRWESVRADELREEFAADEHAARGLEKLERALAGEGNDAAAYLENALGFPDQGEINQATREYIASNRDLLTTRLIDASAPLHSEFDRPDAEATFRMALWPPLTALVIYLALEVNSWWWFAMVVPALLVWQWLVLRRKANDALVAAFVARKELGENDTAKAEVRRGAVRLITEQLRLGYGITELAFLSDYLQKPTPPPSPTSE